MSVDQGFFFAKICGDVPTVNRQFRSMSGTSERLALSNGDVNTYIANNQSVNSINEFNELWPIYKEGIVYLDLRTERNDESLKNSQAIQFIDKNKQLFRFDKSELEDALRMLGLNNKEKVELAEPAQNQNSKESFKFSESFRPQL